MKPLACSFLLIGISTFFGCSSGSAPPDVPAITESTSGSRGSADDAVSGADEEHILGLIQQLVLVDRAASDNPVFDPDIRAAVNPTRSGSRKAIAEENYRKRYRAAEAAAKSLTEHKQAAFPFLVKHFHDNRQSIPMRNVLPSTVGDACYSIVHFQLLDMPDGYSFYGSSRQGRDGKSHELPHRGQTLFDEAGGLDKWLDENKSLSYIQMQVKCLDWLLAREKEIGASDADSYFENILPLEIRIQEHQQTLGKNVAFELVRLREIRDKRLVDQIPSELLPAVTSPDASAAKQ